MLFVLPPLTLKLFLVFYLLLLLEGFFLRSGWLSGEGILPGPPPLAADGRRILKFYQIMNTLNFFVFLHTTCCFLELILH